MPANKLHDEIERFLTTSHSEYHAELQRVISALGFNSCMDLNQALAKTLLAQGYDDGGRKWTATRQAMSFQLPGRCDYLILYRYSIPNRMVPCGTGHVSAGKLSAAELATLLN